jgi:plasmid stabilization system protein ParE
VKLLLSKKAEEDLAGIYSYLLTNAGTATAERFRSDTERALFLLARHPEIGPHPGWATRHRSLRFWLISRTNFVIYYEKRENDVSVERVLDGRRDVYRIIEMGLEESQEEAGADD